MNRNCFKPILPCLSVFVAVLAVAQWHSTVDASLKTGRVENEFWEEAIQKFEAGDRQSPPPKNGILFIGGSNIRRWKLEDDFSDRPVINRGFGGSMIADAVYYADRIVLPYRPKIVVLYGGANDMGSRGRKTPQEVLADYRKFIKAVHDVLPNTRIVYISLPHFYRDRGKPDSIAKVTLVNDLISEASKKNKRLVFVNVNEAMADKNGQPRRELFQADGIHMNAAGYKLWASQLRPHLRLQDDEP
jgi:lysophospholipase L1-like esterase